MNQNVQKSKRASKRAGKFNDPRSSRHYGSVQRNNRNSVLPLFLARKKPQSPLLFSSSPYIPSSLSTDTLLSDTDDLEKDESSPLYKDAPRKLPLQKAFSSTYKALLTVLILLPWALLPMMYKLGYRSGASVLPKLPTHESGLRTLVMLVPMQLSRSRAVKHHLEILDDEFYTTKPENLKYKGIPRPELDDAWNELIATALTMAPSLPPPSYFYWPKTAQSATRSYPRHVGHREHVCVDWDHLQRETSKTRFSILGEEKLLVNPVNPAASLNNVVRPMFKNYSVYDGVDIPELKLFEGLEDGGLEELQQMAKAGGRR
ncbi:hypothetical protein MBM_02978 [Drepanopeziza brunnea f. sp. 'multigermtubi' MB_m1]|uniref:Uncharacterized protein n=1 Tax=Marssonina brunnea f. sp. multigermtubi (strain MB_m1) TaxID=1072389 RepID=K1X0P2_MARBU|nr:uncharacterized protein MBM_02978 [Drepanopeziza brunnea f. sp. 'multigermtubi' MB_m1]EKD18736.1 hypothetical protein MBM_02978 [Drepanopeziza brunnea f. sp. 'multigermtubi' MB_m1]